MQEIIDMGIDGFAPVIINIVPLPSILPLLGLADTTHEQKELGSNSSLDPIEKRDRFKLRDHQQVNLLN